MCVTCFTTAQLVPVGAVAARWWFVNRRQPGPTEPVSEGPLEDGQIFVPEAWAAERERSDQLT